MPLDSTSSLEPKLQPRLGVLFDWDGVVIDSSAQHAKSWERLATEIGKELPEGYFKTSFGMKNELIIPEILEWTRDPALVKQYSLRKEELYRDIIREDGIEPLPGVRTFLERLYAAKIPCVVGTSSHRLNIEVALELFGFQKFFLDIVSSEDVGHGKPDPEVFVKAAERAGVPPQQCVVFEDAPVGIEAGLKGGMKVIGVAGTHPEGPLAGAHRIVKRLDTLTVEDLRALWN